MFVPDLNTDVDGRRYHYTAAVPINPFQYNQKFYTNYLETKLKNVLHCILFINKTTPEPLYATDGSSDIIPGTK